MRAKSCIFITVIVLFLMHFAHQSFAQFYNGSQLSFGKNRVQYIDRFWSFYRFENFETYFYQQGKPLAIYTAKYFSEIKPVLEKKLQTQFDDKIQFVVFNKLTDLKQSNVGFISDAYYNIGGKTHIVGSKVFLYFNGDYFDFQKQIRAGYAHILINNLLYGEYFISMIKNSTLMSLPDWYLNGLISYAIEDWNTEIDNFVRDGIMSGRYNNFYRLDANDAAYAGHSFWHFISQKYGPNVIPNILFMTRISRSIENGFLYVLGHSHKMLMNDWLEYYKNVYGIEELENKLPENELTLKKRHRKAVHHSVKTSPDGKFTAYVTNNMGKSVIWLLDTETNKRKRILRQGHKLDEKVDISYPIMDWHPSGEILTIMREEKGLTALYFYTPADHKKEKRFLFHFDKVLHFSYAPNGRFMAVSAVINGKTNIFVYNVAANTFEIITNDSYNDFEPVFSEDEKYIYFSSNRHSDTLKPERPDDIFLDQAKNINIFAFNYANKNPVLQNVTRSEQHNYSSPKSIDKRHIALLSDESGIKNRYLARFDSVISHIDTTVHYRYFAVLNPITNYERSIIEHYINHDKSQVTDLVFSNGTYKVFQDSINTDFFTPAFPKPTFLKLSAKEKASKEKEEKEEKQKEDEEVVTETEQTSRRRQLIVVNPEEEEKQTKIDIENYVFSEEVPPPPPVAVDTSHKQNDSIADFFEDFILPRQRNYNVEYTIDQMINQLDFSYLNASYQNFTGGKNPIYINPGFNALFKIGLTDLLEDNRIIGGFRFSLDFNQTEYLLSYEMLQYRLDRQITFYRQKIDNIVGINTMLRNTSYMGHYSLKWPFSNVLSLRGTTTYRFDKGIYLSTNLENLQKPDVNSHWGGLKAELIFDNTRNQGYNVLLGSRYKIFAEYFRNVLQKETDLFVVGGDFRHYQKIYRNLVWANRLAASASFGHSKLIYYMGGVDTWLFPRFNDSIDVAQDQNYVYQTLATNMRGFHQNIRNGNNFALINSELRFPVISFFSQKPLKSDFLNSFQIIGFFDMGTAWNGRSPYYEDNPFFTQVYEKHPVKITVYSQKEPVVAGYGLGLRTKLFGYFVRGDMAWGIEDGVIRKPLFYLSLSLDF